MIWLSGWNRNGASQTWVCNYEKCAYSAVTTQRFVRQNIFTTPSMLCEIFQIEMKVNWSTPLWFFFWFVQSKLCGLNCCGAIAHILWIWMKSDQDIYANLIARWIAIRYRSAFFWARIVLMSESSERRRFNFKSSFCYCNFLSKILYAFMFYIV